MCNTRSSYSSSSLLSASTNALSFACCLVLRDGYSVRAGIIGAFRSAGRLSALEFGRSSGKQLPTLWLKSGCGESDGGRGYVEVCSTIVVMWLVVIRRRSLQLGLTRDLLYSRGYCT